MWLKRNQPKVTKGLANALLQGHQAKHHRREICYHLHIHEAISSLVRTTQTLRPFTRTFPTSGLLSLNNEKSLVRYGLTPPRFVHPLDCPRLVAWLRMSCTRNFYDRGSILNYVC